MAIESVNKQKKTHKCNTKYKFSKEFNEHISYSAPILYFVVPIRPALKQFC